MIVSLYTDGGVIGSNPSIIGGTWAWAQVDENGERVQTASGIVRPFLKDPDCRLVPVTNNNTEMIALTRGLLSLPEGWNGNVYCDSKLAIGWTFWNYKHDLVPPVLYIKAMQAKARLGNVNVVLLDGHPTKAHLAAGVGKRGQTCSVHNAWCDKACGERAKEYRETQRQHETHSP